MSAEEGTPGGDNATGASPADQIPADQIPPEAETVQGPAESEAEARLSEVAPGILVAHVPLWHTASTVIVATAPEHSGEALVVDPGIWEVEITALARALGSRGLRVTGGAATHAHFDHVLWHRELGTGTRWAAAAAVAVIGEHPERILRSCAEQGIAVAEAELRAIRPLDPGTPALPWAGRRIVPVIHDAHAPGHLGLVVPDARTLLSGDMLSAREIPLLDTEADDPLGSYRAGFDALARAIDHFAVDTLVPGHGPVLDREQMLEVLSADRAYLETAAAGRAPEDPRLADPWVAEQHEQQLRVLGIG